MHEAVTTVIITGEVGGSGFTAKVTINALVVHIELTWNILRVFVFDVCHCDEGF